MNGKIGKVTILVESARGTAHPPVLASVPFAPGQGVLPAGLILQESASGLVPYTTGTIAGVNDQQVDTANADSGLVIIHGSAIKETLKVGAVSPQPPADATLTALIKFGVFPE